MNPFHFVWDNREVFLFVFSACWLGIFYQIWLRFKDRQPYGLAKLTEHFTTEVDEDFRPFQGRAYRLEIALYPTTCLSHIIRLEASSGKLCRIDEWMWKRSAVRESALDLNLYVDRSDVRSDPVLLEFWYLPESPEDLKRLKLWLVLDRLIARKVDVRITYVGPKPLPKPEIDEFGNPVLRRVEPIPDDEGFEVLKKRFRR